jgi:hypothetical protein
MLDWCSILPDNSSGKRYSPTEDLQVMHPPVNKNSAVCGGLS